jgi:hypothetical protein
MKNMDLEQMISKAKGRAQILDHAVNDSISEIEGLGAELGVDVSFELGEIYTIIIEGYLNRAMSSALEKDGSCLASLSLAGMYAREAHIDITKRAKEINDMYERKNNDK